MPLAALDPLSGVVSDHFAGLSAGFHALAVDDRRGRALLAPLPGLGSGDRACRGRAPRSRSLSRPGSSRRSCCTAGSPAAASATGSPPEAGRRSHPPPVAGRSSAAVRRVGRLEARGRSTPTPDPSHRLHSSRSGAHSRPGWPPSTPSDPPSSLARSHGDQADSGCSTSLSELAPSRKAQTSDERESESHSNWIEIGAEALKSRSPSKETPASRRLRDPSRSRIGGR
jgi:hypothetical protein